MKEEMIVMYDSPEAAHESVLTVDGKSSPCWVSRHGKVYNQRDAEHLARYDGCTHRACGLCGAPTERHYTACDKCREAAAVKRHAERERRPLNGEYIYSNAADEFFDEWSDVESYCEEHGTTPADLRLLICEPVMAREIDPNDYYADDLPDDCGVPKEIEDAFQALAEAIRDCKTPLSWRPTKFAVDLDACEHCGDPGCNGACCGMDGE